ncbi:hypothetical protein PHYBLDRAFT_176321 [Phycomyces blakesleeanus NRRL 1555(-)]|uniref:Uncharacterized protein n=1 Tax=Phycomyces blakesleeanus (strain ATCC 8743b / DSM 1359 / FGSC 10004 / NBRC 33097 / NRRL 1555) TaxID=763407 RepID=A0A162T9B2_PHYB8|nr:hypothetical protein PHYBLDRAFT_176321 [Phycomyces blakesleeanus NRRL 1555(-)]OAD65203.1 hypothetical protein PHYBLDRAFT_176321 [Phycomyces blakesleeanus NRRL 1555(-)]|eukprot:XP_018283243.1 hypothetical protein PHYBLDRAFT_176321 [Phycomyces blakesleeanus NRRL 1555(-)]
MKAKRQSTATEPNVRAIIQYVKPSAGACYYIGIYQNIFLVGLFDSINLLISSTLAWTLLILRVIVTIVVIQDILYSPCLQCRYHKRNFTISIYIYVIASSDFDNEPDPARQYNVYLNGKKLICLAATIYGSANPLRRYSVCSLD